MIKDHNGTSYPSIKTMCDAYNICPGTYLSRIKNGMPQKMALTTPAAKRGANFPPGRAFVYKGKQYPSITKFCNENNLTSYYSKIADILNSYGNDQSALESAIDRILENRSARKGTKHRARVSKVPARKTSPAPIPSNTNPFVKEAVQYINEASEYLALASSLLVGRVDIDLLVKYSNLIKSIDEIKNEFGK